MALSTVRIYLIYIGTFEADFSWYYNPQLVVESSEVGGTLIALSVPGLKPLLGKWGSKIATIVSTNAFATHNKGTNISNPHYLTRSDRSPSNVEETYELPKSAATDSVFLVDTDLMRTV